MNSTFLTSEFTLNRLKEPHELAALAGHWNDQWVSLRGQWKSASANDRDRLLQATDLAASQAWRVEALIERRRQLQPRQLRVLFREARLNYLEERYSEKFVERTLESEVA